jgi:hypothetical protein
MNSVRRVLPNVHQMPDQQVQKRNKLLIAGALAIVLVALPIFYSVFKSNHTNSCSVSSDLSISTKAPEEHAEYCRQFTAGMKDIDGVPIEEIEKLAQIHGIYGKRSLKEKLFEDCLKVQKMGTTNAELADHLSAIIKQWPQDFQSEILYDPTLLTNNTMGNCSKVRSLLKGHPLHTNSCIPKGLNIFNEIVIPCPQAGHRIEDPLNKIKIGITDKKIARIREGLYDGFDPIDVATILTGHSVDSIKQATGTAMQTDEINSALSSIVSFHY